MAVWRVPPWFGAMLAAMSILVSAGVSFWMSAIVADHRAYEATTTAQLEEIRGIAVSAKSSGDEANAELKRRGLDPVPIPRPGTASDTEVIVQSATAEATRRVLENIRQPKDGEDGQRGPRGREGVPGMPGESIQGPVGPAGETPPCMSEPAQCRGADGTDGHTPTTAEIREVIVDMIGEDTDAVLCPLGGSYQGITVMVPGPPPNEDDIWTCT